MAFLVLSLFEHPSGAAFDPEKVIRKVRACIPEAIFLPGDQAAAEVQRGEKCFAKELEAHPAGPAHKVVESLRRKARSYGPCFAFNIPLPSGGLIHGLARSVDTQFLFEEPLPPAMRQRLIDFLKSLGIGRLSASTGDRNNPEEVLDDMGGPADSVCRPETPWKLEMLSWPGSGSETP